MMSLQKALPKKNDVEEYIYKKSCQISLKINERNTYMQSEDLKQKKKKYDTVCKKVLSQKPILAKILKSCVSEYKDYDMKFIEEQCIEGNTVSFNTGVNPDESYHHITGDDTVDKLEREGTVYYDIRFNTLVPGTDEYIKLIINIEAQTIQGKKEPPFEPTPKS